jgi:hypothetical protein
MSWRPGQAYSQDLRERVLAAVDGGMAVREAAPLFRVSIAFIYKARIRRRLTGETTARPQRCHLEPLHHDLLESPPGPDRRGKIPKLRVATDRPLYAAACRTDRARPSFIVASNWARIHFQSASISCAALPSRAYSVTPRPAATAS